MPITSGFLKKVCLGFGIADYYLYLCNVELVIILRNLGIFRLPTFRKQKLSLRFYTLTALIVPLCQGAVFSFTVYPNCDCY